jgi:uncharacterized protein YukE
MFMVTDQGTMTSLQGELATNASTLASEITRLRGAWATASTAWKAEDQLIFNESLDTLNLAVEQIGQVVDGLGVAVQTHARNVQAVQDAGSTMFRLG